MNRKVLLTLIFLIGAFYLFIKLRYPNVDDLYSDGLVYHKWTRMPFNGTLIDVGDMDKSIVKYKEGKPHGFFDYYVQNALVAWGQYIEAPEFERECKTKLGIQYMVISKYSDEFQPKSDTCLRDLVIEIVVPNSKFKQNDYLEMSEKICGYTELIKMNEIKSVHIIFLKSFHDNIRITSYNCKKKT
jgi:hypothetical protein